MITEMSVHLWNALTANKKDMVNLTAQNPQKSKSVSIALKWDTHQQIVRSLSDHESAEIAVKKDMLRTIVRMIQLL
jgi:hypothetical protein